MEKIVILSPQAMEGICARPDYELVVARDEGEFSSRIISLLQDGSDETIGRAARARVLEDYSWNKGLGRMDMLLSRSQAI